MTKKTAEVVYNIQDVAISAPHSSANWVHVLTNMFYSLEHDGRLTMTLAVCDISAGRTAREFTMAVSETFGKQIINTLTQLVHIIPSDVKIAFRKADNATVTTNKSGKIKIVRYAPETPEEDKTGKEIVEGVD